MPCLDSTGGNLEKFDFTDVVSLPLNDAGLLPLLKLGTCTGSSTSSSTASWTQKTSQKIAWNLPLCLSR